VKTKEPRELLPVSRGSSFSPHAAGLGADFAVPPPRAAHAAGADYRRLRDFSSVLLASESFASRPETPLATRGTDVRRTDVRLRVRVIQLLLSESVWGER
jgi:hypothetical protein